MTGVQTCALPIYPNRIKFTGSRGKNLFSVQDATIAASYAQLAATALGLSSIWIGTINKREILKKAILEFGKKKIDHEYFGQLLTEHHMVLKNTLQVSTDKIENMIHSAMSAGALGSKINGSGGGGCMFAYAPDNPKKVANAIENAGGKAYIVQSDIGTRIEG